MKKYSERKRIKEIISVFIKYSVREGLAGITNPSQIRKAMEELGPTFIKIGQILSTRPDIIPESFVQEFQKLQDEVKPESFDVVREIVEKELGGPISDIFLSFDTEPIASASLAQVHTARLKDGQEVVAKIQRPKAKATMFSDIRILKRLTLFMKLTPQGHVLDPEEVVDELMQAARNELDFLNEAQNIKRFRENNEDVRYIQIPRVYEQYTTSNILVMDYIRGIKIADTNRLTLEGYDLKDMASKLAYNYLKQVFDDGFFHADPHPGNILISGNRIAYIDFGMMGVLNKSMMKKFNSFLFGVASRNVEAMAGSLVRIGIKRGNINNKKLYSDVEQIYNKYIDESLYDIELPGLLDEIFKAFRKNNITMPREITMLMKGLMTIEGVGMKLAPDLNIMEIVVPYMKSRMMDRMDFRQEVGEQLENLYTLSKIGLKIPVKMLELMNYALAGNLKVQMEHTNLEKSINELNRMVNRIVFGIVVASFILGSSLLIRVDAGPKLYGVSAFGLFGYVSTAVFGIWLLISIMRSGKI